MIALRSLVACLFAGLLTGGQALAGNDSLLSGLAPELKISYSLGSWNGLETSAIEQGDVWQRVRGGFRLEEVNDALTRQHEAWFSKRADHLQSAIDRSRLYLYHIVGEVEKRGMPTEIALLPMIESAFNPMALSPRQASGIWQFIPATGRVFGLQQNAWYDGRRDVLAATRAALDYLETLHRQFGSWELALAAYNCGEGCVARAIARNKAQGRPVRYADLSLPTETRHYVPKLLAVRNILMNPEQAGITLQTLANEPYFIQVSINGPMATQQVARLAGMSFEEFVALNPAYQRRVIHSDTPAVLLLPVDKVETFNLNLQQKGSDKHTLQVYQGKKGESVSRIAEKFGVTLQWLKEHNPIRLTRGKLAASQSLYVPRLADHKRAEPGGRATTRSQTVRRGESLDGLASLYDVRVSGIRLHNDKGESLLTPGTRPDVPPANG